MGLHGVAQFINAFNRSIACRVKADGVVSADNIVVNRAGHTDAGYAQAGQRLRTAERPVTAAADQPVNPEILTSIDCFLQPFFGHHFLAAGGVKHGAALTDNAVNAARRHLNDIAVNEAAVAPADTEYGNAMCRSCAHDSADHSVHARGVAAAGEDANPANGFLVHFIPSMTCVLSISQKALAAS